MSVIGPVAVRKLNFVMNSKINSEKHFQLAANNGLTIYVSRMTYVH